MPGRKWTAEEKANIVLEVLTTTASTAEICRR
jgi:transposase-like protein